MKLIWCMEWEVLRDMAEYLWEGFLRVASIGRVLDSMSGLWRSLCDLRFGFPQDASYPENILQWDFPQILFFSRRSSGRSHSANKWVYRMLRNDAGVRANVSGYTALNRGLQIRDKVTQLLCFHRTGKMPIASCCPITTTVQAHSSHVSIKRMFGYGMPSRIESECRISGREFIFFILYRWRRPSSMKEATRYDVDAMSSRNEIGSCVV